jgi:hypothetical protein
MQNVLSYLFQFGRKGKILMQYQKNDNNTACPSIMSDEVLNEKIFN